MPQKNSVLQELAKKKLAELQSKRFDANESLYDFITRITPKYSAPRHLEPIIERLEMSDKEPLRICYSVPPRHSKTESLCHLMARYLIRYPDKTVAYCSYTASIAEEKSKLVQRYFTEAGGVIDPAKKGAARWLTTDRGGMIAVGVGGPLTSLGVDLLVIDDPHRNRAEAESAQIRENTFGWFTSTATSRMEPGSSAIVCHTRWHADDVIGRLTTGQWGEWEYVNLPAIDDNGEALWPERWPLEELLKRKSGVGEYDWSALYQGSPRPRGSGVFGGTTLFRYEEDKDPRHEGLPILPRITTVSIGIDLSYTQKSYSDYSAAVVMGRGEDNRFYILDVIRVQCEPPVFATKLAGLKSKYGASNIFWFISGVEKGVLPFMKNAGINIRAEVTNKDKFVRAIETAAAWNRKDILLPVNAPWLESFTGEVLAFTGVNDAKDDQVDAMVAGYHLIGAKQTIRMLGTRPLLPF